MSSCRTPGVSRLRSLRKGRPWRVVFHLYLGEMVCEIVSLPSHIYSVCQARSAVMTYWWLITRERVFTSSTWLQYVQIIVFL